MVLVGFLQRKKKPRFCGKRLREVGLTPAIFCGGGGGIKVDDDDSCVVVFDIFVGLGTTPNLLGNHPIFETILYF